MQKPEPFEHEEEAPTKEAKIKGIPETSPKPNYRKDIKSILLLFSLYILQGIPLGLIVTVPFLLQAKGVPYKDQAKFSLAYWPFSLKVLYAPIIDAIYWKRLGRRKSWLIPLQYLISIFLFILAFRVEDLFEERHIGTLTASFFALNFLAASQDVAVDGWALTMLSPENVGYASTCNAVGQTLGFVMGYSGFLALDSVAFANKFRSVPLDHGLVSLPQFLIFWAIVFAITTTLILIFKEEKKETEAVSDQHMNIFESYKNLWKILKLRNIQILICFLLTVRVGTAATDALTKLKLVEKGIPKETLAFFSIPLIPVKLILPILAAKWTVGSSPMKLYVNTIPFSILFGVIWPLLVFWMTSTSVKGSDGEYPFWFFVLLFGVFALELIPNFTRFVTGMGFAAKVSDPAIGGTYMTLINTISNVGGTWPVSLALYLVDYVGIGRECPQFERAILDEEYNVTMTTMFTPIENDTNTTVSNITGLVLDSVSTAKCVSKVDGYYVESLACLVIGIVWYFWGRPTILRLQRKPLSSWRVF